MVMSPRSEDFERLAIRWADAPHVSDGYPNMIAAISAFPELFVSNRDRLPQNDTDRAFALVCRACEILDRRVAFAKDEAEAARLTEEAVRCLDEALKLDPACHDARRIRHALEFGARDSIVSFLEEGSDEVLASCEATARACDLEVPRGDWSLSVYMRPYLRWRLNLANEQLNCGRYRCSLAVCEDLLELDTRDMAGARLIAAYDCVKLEDQQALATLIGRYPDDANNAWFLLSRCFMAYKQRRLDDAAAILHQIVNTYQLAGRTLTYQDELPAGMFGHLEYLPGTADELFVAVSEAAVIFDENCGDGFSPLSQWIANDPIVIEACQADEARVLGADSAEGEPAHRSRRTQQAGRTARAKGDPAGVDEDDPASGRPGPGEGTDAAGPADADSVLGACDAPGTDDAPGVRDVPDTDDASDAHGGSDAHDGPDDDRKGGPDAGLL